MALSEILASEAEPEPEPESESVPAAGQRARRGRLRRGPRKRRPAHPGRPERAARPEPAPRPDARRPLLQAVGAAVMLLGLLVLGFYVYLYGLSGLSEQRAQSALYKTFAGQLDQAVAPTGSPAITEGAPVAILDIPALGLHDLVVVEGTTAQDLTHGPGHLRDSVLPGQYGVSVIYGRAATYGGPFAHLMRLRRGDRITVITGQGTATYVVESFGTTARPAPDPTRNRLLLVTAAGTGVPTSWAEVSADLWSAPRQTPSTWPGISAQEPALAGNPGALLPLVLWSQALLLVSVGGTVAAHFWSRRAALLCAAPAVLALVWTVYENVSLLLPNLS